MQFDVISVEFVNFFLQISFFELKLANGHLNLLGKMLVVAELVLSHFFIIDSKFYLLFERKEIFF